MQTRAFTASHRAGPDALRGQLQEVLGDSANVPVLLRPPRAYIAEARSQERRTHNNRGRRSSVHTEFLMAFEGHPVQDYVWYALPGHVEERRTRRELRRELGRQTFDEMEEAWKRQLAAAAASDDTTDSQPDQPLLNPQTQNEFAESQDQVPALPVPFTQQPFPDSLASQLPDAHPQSQLPEPQAHPRQPVQQQPQPPAQQQQQQQGRNARPEVRATTVSRADPTRIGFQPTGHQPAAAPSAPQHAPEGPPQRLVLRGMNPAAQPNTALDSLLLTSGQQQTALLSAANQLGAAAGQEMAPSPASAQQAQPGLGPVASTAPLNAGRPAAAAQQLPSRDPRHSAQSMPPSLQVQNWPLQALASMTGPPTRPAGPRSAPAQAAHTPVQPPATSLSVQPQPSNPLIQAQARPAPLPAGPMPSIALFSRPNPGVQGMSNLASLVQSRASTGQIQAPSNPQSGPHAGTLTTPAQLQRPGIHAPAAPHSAPAAADGAANARQQPRRRSAGHPVRLLPGAPLPPRPSDEDLAAARLCAQLFGAFGARLPIGQPDQLQPGASPLGPSAHTAGPTAHTPISPAQVSGRQTVQQGMHAEQSPLPLQAQSHPAADSYSPLPNPHLTPQGARGAHTTAAQQPGNAAQGMSQVPPAGSQQTGLRLSSQVPDTGGVPDTQPMDTAPLDPPHDASQSQAVEPDDRPMQPADDADMPFPDTQIVDIVGFSQPQWPNDLADEDQPAAQPPQDLSPSQAAATSTHSHPPSALAQQQQQRPPLPPQQSGLGTDHHPNRHPALSQPQAPHGQAPQASQPAGSQPVHPAPLSPAAQRSGRSGRSAHPALSLPAFSQPSSRSQDPGRSGMSDHMQPAGLGAGEEEATQASLGSLPLQQPRSTGMPSPVQPSTATPAGRQQPQHPEPLHAPASSEPPGSIRNNENADPASPEGPDKQPEASTQNPWAAWRALIPRAQVRSHEDLDVHPALIRPTQEASAFTTPPRSRTSHPALQPLGYGRSPPGLPREDAAQAQQPTPQSRRLPAEQHGAASNAAGPSNATNAAPSPASAPRQGAAGHSGRDQGGAAGQRNPWASWAQHFQVCSRAAERQRAAHSNPSSASKRQRLDPHQQPPSNAAEHNPEPPAPNADADAEDEEHTLAELQQQLHDEARDAELSQQPLDQQLQAQAEDAEMSDQTHDEPLQQLGSQAAEVSQQPLNQQALDQQLHGQASEAETRSQPLDESADQAGGQSQYYTPPDDTRADAEAAHHPHVKPEPPADDPALRPCQLDESLSRPETAEGQDEAEQKPDPDVLRTHLAAGQGQLPADDGGDHRGEQPPPGVLVNGVADDGSEGSSSHDGSEPDPAEVLRQAELENRLSPEGWMGATIRGARRSEEELLLRVQWPDGHVEWVANSLLHGRPHCLLLLVLFYESKVRSRRNESTTGSSD